MRRIFKNKGGIVLSLVLAVALIGLLIASPAWATGNWKQKFIRFSAVAGETLAVGQAVCIATTDGKAYKADANDAALRPAVGVIDKGGATGVTVEIVVEGILGGMTRASAGLRLFLSETAGAITVTAPTNAQILGWVLPGPAGELDSSPNYYIRVLPPTSTGAGY